MTTKTKRVLAIDPSPQGLGFALMEGPRMLVDWGVKQISGDDKNAASLRQIDELIALYEPDVLVLEDTDGRGSLRRERVRELLERAKTAQSAHDLKVVAFARLVVSEAFARHGAITKYQIAQAIAERLPELAPRLPPPRKLWMSEDYRMSIFDATALALTFYYLHK